MTYLAGLWPLIPDPDEYQRYDLASHRPPPLRLDCRLRGNDTELTKAESARIWGDPEQRSDLQFPLH
jgi:hypothetical protein